MGEEKDEAFKRVQARLCTAITIEVPTTCNPFESSLPHGTTDADFLNDLGWIERDDSFFRVD